MPSLLILLDHHARLDAILREHQEALIGLDLDRARERLATWADALLAHMAHEDREVLPRYAKLPRVRGGGVEMFDGEHKRLRELMAEVREKMAAIDPRAADARGRIVELFDRTALLKGLLEHHDLRERQLLYPRLDEALSDDERRAVLDGAPTPP